MDKFGLPLSDAQKKAFEIMQHDAEHIKNDRFLQLFCTKEELVKSFTSFDPDTVFSKMSSLESNQMLLHNEIYFLIKMSLATVIIDDAERLTPLDMIRYTYLLNKYNIKPSTNFEAMTVSSPLVAGFSKILYNVLNDNPYLCPPFPDILKDYKNFKKEYQAPMMSLLPSGMKYGGFVKAVFLYGKKNACRFHQLENAYLFQETYMAYLRVAYNSKIYSNEERLEWFEKTGITENDCALWSQLFDQQYPDYKNIHKLFGQVA